MEHPHENTLHAYADQTLGLLERKALQDHLSRCPQCRDEVDELTLLFHELNQLPSPGPNRRLTTRILLAQQRERWGNIISFDLFAFLFGRTGWAAVAMGLLAGILLGVATSNIGSPSTDILESSYVMNDQQDLYLDYLISDNGDVL